MKLVKRKSSSRWIYPFPGDDATGLEMRSVSPSESAAVLDKYRITIGGKNGTTFTQNMKANMELMKLSVLGWKNFLGADGNPLPCTDENKELLHDKTICVIDGVTDEGEPTQFSIWEAAQKLFREAEDADRKNAVTSPRSVTQAATPSATSA